MGLETDQGHGEGMPAAASGDLAQTADFIAPGSTQNIRAMDTDQHNALSGLSDAESKAMLQLSVPKDQLLKDGLVEIPPGVKVHKILGSGGFGTVYLVSENNVFQAMKCLKPGSSEKNRARFLREIKFMREDNGKIFPKFVPDSFVDGAQLSYRMQFHDGGSLDTLTHEHFPRNPLPKVLACDIGLLVAVLVAKLHRKSLVHRDLKLGNVHLDTTGRVRLLDPGLAFSLDAGADVEQLTESGEPLGTLLNAPLEQLLDAHTADERADVFALGVILYQLLTGKLPHDTDSAPKLREMRENHQISFDAIPEELRGILSSMLQKDPTRRPFMEGAKGVILHLLPHSSLKSDYDSERSLIDAHPNQLLLNYRMPNGGHLSPLDQRPSRVTFNELIASAPRHAPPLPPSEEQKSFMRRRWLVTSGALAGVGTVIIGGAYMLLSQGGTGDREEEKKDREPKKPLVLPKEKINMSWKPSLSFDLEKGVLFSQESADVTDALPANLLTLKNLPQEYKGLSARTIRTMRGGQLHALLTRLRPDLEFKTAEQGGFMFLVSDGDTMLLCNGSGAIKNGKPSTWMGIIILKKGEEPRYAIDEELRDPGIQAVLAKLRGGSVASIASTTDPGLQDEDSRKVHINLGNAFLEFFHNVTVNEKR